jgi:hypothetical protein
MKRLRRVQERAGRAALKTGTESARRRFLVQPRVGWVIGALAAGVLFILLQGDVFLGLGRGEAVGRLTLRAETDPGFAWPRTVTVSHMIRVETPQGVRYFGGFTPGLFGWIEQEAYRRDLRRPNGGWRRPYSLLGLRRGLPTADDRGFPARVRFAGLGRQIVYAVEPLPEAK